MKSYDNLNPNKYEFALHDSAIYISPIEEGLLYSAHFEFPHAEKLTCGQLLESVWEMNPNLSYKETIKRMKELGFIHNEEFQKNMIKNNGYIVEEEYGLIDPEDVYFCFCNGEVWFQLIKEYEKDGYLSDFEIPFRKHIEEELELDVGFECCFSFAQDQEVLKNQLISFGYVYNEAMIEKCKEFCED